MKQTYTGRMIVYYTAIFLAIFSGIFFFVVQGSLFYHVLQTEKNMNRQAQNTTVYLAEEAGLSGSIEYYSQNYENKASALTDHISQMTGYSAFLINNGGKLLFSDTDKVSELFHQQYDYSKTHHRPTSIVSVINHTSYLQYVAPIMVGKTDLGYVGFVYSMSKIEKQMDIISVFFIVMGCIGLLVMVFLTRKKSNAFIQSINQLTDFAEKVNAGQYEFCVPDHQFDEIDQLTLAFNAMVNNINAIIDQLYSERNRLSGVLATLDDGLLALDPEGNVTTFNAHIKTYFNINNPKTIYDFQFQTFLHDIFNELKNGKAHISMEVECNDRDLMIIGSPIRNTGFEENYMIVIRNMTAANQIKKDQQQFISSVSHELRTPLTTIIGYTDMILRRNLSENAVINRSVTTINQEGHRLLRLVDELLSVNRLETPELSIRKANLDLQKLLPNVIEQMKIKSQEKDIDINFTSENELPEILGDYDRLQQVFINIIHNAIKYSNPGAIIDIIATTDEEWVNISVRDYGIGIPSVELEKIFSAFYRVEKDRARSDSEGGAGLGLYLVRQIITKHQGDIMISSIVGEGTNVTIKLPVITQLYAEAKENEA